MVKPAPFDVVYAEAVQQHLQSIDRKYHSLIQTAVEQQLRHEPDVETRNRKPLQRPIVPGAPWELRFGPNNRFRLFYDVNVEQRIVRILAVGVKERNRLTIGREVFET